MVKDHENPHVAWLHGRLTPPWLWPRRPSDGPQHPHPRPDVTGGQPENLGNSMENGGFIGKTIGKP